MDVSVMTASEGEECLGAMNAALGAMERFSARIEQIEKRLDALEDDGLVDDAIRHNGLVVCDHTKHCNSPICAHRNPHEIDEFCDINECPCPELPSGQVALCVPTKEHESPWHK